MYIYIVCIHAYKYIQLMYPLFGRQNKGGGQDGKKEREQ
jgi:hypothetical protein